LGPICIWRRRHESRFSKISSGPASTFLRGPARQASFGIGAQRRDPCSAGWLASPFRAGHHGDRHCGRRNGGIFIERVFAFGWSPASLRSRDATIRRASRPLTMRHFSVLATFASTVSRLGGHEEARIAHAPQALLFRLTHESIRSTRFICASSCPRGAAIAPTALATRLTFDSCNPSPEFASGIFSSLFRTLHSDRLRAPSPAFSPTPYARARKSAACAVINLVSQDKRTCPCGGLMDAERPWPKSLRPQTKIFPDADGCRRQPH